MVSEGCVMGLCTVCESGVSVCFLSVCEKVVEVP